MTHCVCVCVCVCGERERERDEYLSLWRILWRRRFRMMIPKEQRGGRHSQPCVRCYGQNLGLLFVSCLMYFFKSFGQYGSRRDQKINEENTQEWFSLWLFLTSTELNAGKWIFLCEWSYIPSALALCGNQNNKTFLENCFSFIFNFQYCNKILSLLLHRSDSPALFWLLSFIHKFYISAKQFLWVQNSDI